MKSNQNIKIAIIGGGAAGIVTAKSAVEEGLSCDLFESASTPGGVWRSDGLAWPRMRVNTSRFTGVFSDFSWEQAFPGKDIHPYPTTIEMNAYLSAYIKHFSLGPYIHTGRQVTHITKNEGKWTVSWKEGNKLYQNKYDYVVLATGRYQVPQVPHFKGVENFSGEIIHSAQYRSADHFKNKSVLVIGGSLSGVAIAGELTGQVTHLIQRPRWIMPTQLTIDTLSTKIPSDLLQSRKTHQPRTFTWYMKHCGKQNTFPNWEMKPETPPANVVSDVYIKKLQQASITVITDEIESFTKADIKLKKGRTVKVDSVILCTGYKYDFSYLDRELAKKLQTAFTFFEDTFHPEIEGLAFIGINYQSRGAIFPLIELQARFALAIFSGRITLPSEEKMKEAIVKTPIRDGFAFANALALKLGILDFDKILQQDRILHGLLLEGAVVPAQYRVVGFGSCLDLAKKTLIMTEQYRQRYLGGNHTVFFPKNKKLNTNDNPNDHSINKPFLTSRL